MMQARARVLMDPSVQSLRRQQGADAVAASAPLPERLLALYGSALASTQLRDWPRADQALDKALAALQPAPDANAEHALQWLRVQSLVARGDGAGALRLADTLGGSDTRSALLLRSQAATAMATAKSAQWQAASRQSMEALQTWVSLHPHDGTAWSQLSQNAAQLGLRLRSVRAEAEARAAIGDVGGAIDRLRAGQRFARNAAAEDFVDASIIEARLRELEHQRRQLMAEMRGERRAPSGGDEPR
jgi:predicted Zn-dependent protease